MSAAKQRRNRWWQRVAWALVALLAGSSLLVIGVEIAVRQPGVREAIKDRLVQIVAERTGLSLAIEDLQASLLGGRAVVVGVTLSSPGENALLATERIEVAWRLSSLWKRPLTLRRLILTEPRLDLGAAMPELPARPGADGSDFALAIEHFELVEGQIEGPVLTSELRSWIERWWLEDLRVEGRYLPQGLDLKLDSLLRWVRSDGEQVEMTVTGELSGPQQGPWELGPLGFSADGLWGEVTATVGTSESDPLIADFEIRVDPHLLVPVPSSGGPIQIYGRFDTGQQTGHLYLGAAALPIEIVSPWLPPEINNSPFFPGWRLLVDATFNLAKGNADPTGMAELRLFRQQTTWATADVELLTQTADGGLEVRIATDLLPDRVGERRVRAVVDVDDWRQADGWTILDSRAQIVGTDLADLRQDLATLWPEPLPEAIDRVLIGVLEARATATGPLADLQFGLEGRWRDGEAANAMLRASASAGQMVVETISGRIGDRQFSGGGKVDLPTPIARAEAQLELIQPLPEVPLLDLSLILENGVATVEARPQTSNGVTSTLTAVVPAGSLADLPEVGNALAALPVVGAKGPLRVDWQIPEAEWSGLASRLDSELPVDSLQLGSHGSLVLDPTKPLAGRGEVVLDGLGVEGWDLAVGSQEPVKIRLDRGELIVETARLETEGGLLEVEAWSELATEWRPGDDPESLLRRFRAEANGATPVALVQAFVDDVYTDGDLQVALSLSGTTRDIVGEVRVLGPQAQLRLGDAEGVRLANPTLEIVFEGDRIRLERARLEIDSGEIGATGEITLSTLLGLLDSERRDSEAALEPLTLRLEIPPADWAPSLAKLGVEEPPEPLEAAGRGELRVDPLRPLEAEGWFEVSPLSMTTAGHTVRNDGPLRVDFANGRLELTSLELLADDQPFELAGSVELDRAWSADQSMLSLVDSLSVKGGGTLAAILLNPFLAGGSAEGLIQLDLDLEGTLEDPVGRMQIRGPDASVLYVSPYVAKLDALELDLELVDGRAQILDGRLRLNDGDVELEGSLGLDGADVMAAFDGLRFRLDYGLLVRVDGELRLDVDSQGSGRMTGEIIVDQGSLTRPISIDRDFIANLLSPVDLIGTEVSPLEQIDLDLRLDTRRGVRVRNNVADLAVRWNAVRVRGNLLQPVIDGRFAVEPGGRAFLFGQTLRIDRGILTFPGQPDAEAILDLETTSSLDDPSIGRLEGEDMLALTPTEPAEDLEGQALQAGWGAAAFVGEQVATRINEAVPGARFVFRPILIFGEADPEARLTVGREFSRYVTLAASIDLRNAERQTYLMDAHRIPGLPGMVAQIFTNDQDQEGATLQHRMRFGAYRRTAPTGPNLRRLEIEAVPEVSRKALRRSVGLAKGDRASPDDLFLSEVEVGEFLRRAGYPDARVKVKARPVPERPEKVDLDVAIDPGPQVSFQFEGESLSRGLRRSITPLYRADFYEPVALDEMQAQTVRSLRSLGYLRPQVEIEVEPTTTADGRDQRIVTIRMQGGEQLPLETLELEGLSEAEANQVAGSFGTRVQLVELAAGETSADRRLLAGIRGLGYPQPTIAGRNLSEDGRRLTVEVEPGPASHLDKITVKGVEVAEAAELLLVAGIEVGDVARRDRIAGGALAIEAEFHRRGYVDALVRSRLEINDAELAGPVELVYKVEPGISFTVADTQISGLRATSKRWATSVAEMESGAPLREDEVAAARSRLYDTGLFTMVGSESIATEGGRTEIVFDVEERPRYSVAYGLRWDSADGTQGVIDLVDGNFLGRGVTLGLRALYARDDWNLRLAAGVPRLFGTRAALELFGSFQNTFEEISEELFTSQFDQQILEASVQVAYPFGDSISGRIYGRYRTVDLLVTEIDEDPIFPLPPTSLDFKFNTPLLGTLWIYDTRDRALVLTAGSFASLDLSGTGEFLNSDFEYIRMYSQFNLYRPVARWGGRGFTWAQSLRLGLADSFAQELDRDDRFFAGGQYSVRGYPRDSLGPVEELGDSFFPLGGKTVVVINEELRFDLLGPVAGLVFVDLGNVWEGTAEFDSSLFKSLGLGLRAVTPVGLLRLDWAFPLDRREGDPSSEIYFGFGNTF